MKQTTDKTKKIKNLFGEKKGEKFGGSSNRLMLEVGEVVHGFVYLRKDLNVKLADDSDPIDLFVAVDPRTGEELRMPAAAIFRKNAGAAKLNVGDVFSVGRNADSKKQKGKGKGKEMEVYELMVTKRLEPGAAKKSKK